MRRDEVAETEIIMRQITIARIEETGAEVKRLITAMNVHHRNHVSCEAHLWATIESDSNGNAYASVYAYEDNATPCANNSIKLADFTADRHYTREDKQKFAESITNELREAMSEFENGELAFSDWCLLRSIDDE